MKTITQKTFIKIAGLSSVVIALILFALFMVGNRKNVDLKDLPINYLHGNFSVDVDNPREIVGDADYYFVARVESIDGTEYRHAVTIETEDGFKEVSSPYTNYTITIIQNLKGLLVQDVPISILKSGGVNKDEKSITLYEQDFLPEIGQYYVISAYAQKDGSLLISGPNSNELLPDVSKSRLSHDNNYEQYQKYFDEEVAVERERYTSIYDKK